jgi:hypothetical protein
MPIHSTDCHPECLVKKYFLTQSERHQPGAQPMNLSPQDATEALEAYESADRRARQVAGYREASPFFILWGCVWVVANTVTDFAPRHGGSAWLAGVAVGVIGTALLVVGQIRRRAYTSDCTPAQGALFRRRMLLLGLTMFAYFPAMFAVLQPLTGRQQNAFISLFWAFAYMVAGAWRGMRVFVAGLVTAAAIMVGYLYIHEHFALWMAVAGGGSLLSAGLWLRKI